MSDPKYDYGLHTNQYRYSKVDKNNSLIRIKVRKRALINMHHLDGSCDQRPMEGSETSVIRNFDSELEHESSDF